MKRADAERDDELRPEYNLKNLRVRKVGPNRKGFRGQAIQLEPEGAIVFSDSK